MEKAGTSCRYCGREVEWLTSRAGKKYLAEAAPIYNEDGRHIKTVYPAHRCEVSGEQRAVIDQIEADRTTAALEAGEIVKGQRIVVVKGRKFPIGTEGTITWVAAREDAYGVVKVRVATDNGDNFYINKQNIEATNRRAS